MLAMFLGVFFFWGGGVGVREKKATSWNFNI